MTEILWFMIGLLALPASVFAVAFAVGVWQFRKPAPDSAPAPDNRDWLIVAYDDASEESSGELMTATMPPETTEEKAKATAINIR